jgi:transaldolase/glucose-6-phosphate isomerase
MNTSFSIITSLPPAVENAFKLRVSAWEQNDTVGRIWAGDASLWTNSDEHKWLGWLDVIEAQLASLDQLREVQRNAATNRFDHALVLGMGGSSLSAKLFRTVFGRIDGAPDLHVLDSTDPAQIKSLENQLDLSRTLFIISSKSGTTLESKMFRRYFFKRVEESLGAKRAANNFIAITDSGSELDEIARLFGFSQIVHGVPNIGGRYSALSSFGMIPASIIGLDVERLLRRADVMRVQCGPNIPVRNNPGAILGLALGVAAEYGRDKVTIVTSPRILELGGWLEQLLSESTGKRGKGLIPVVGECLGGSDSYGMDRVFVYVRDECNPDKTQDRAVDKLKSDGQAVISMHLQEIYDVGAELFRWEFATIVAAAVLGVNPFDQPDVEASKLATKRLTKAYERTGEFPVERPIARDQDLDLYCNDVKMIDLADTGKSLDLTRVVTEHLSKLAEGDYLAILAYVELNSVNHDVLQRIRHSINHACRVATCLGYGPQYLHSTGQLYKGGPNTGVFFQITCEDVYDLPVPGFACSFGAMKASQALGDFESLSKRGRRVVRMHIRGEVQSGLHRIAELIRKSIQALH